MKPHKLCAPCTVVFLTAFFALVGFVQAVLGQGCSSWMTPSYSTYASSSSDGTYVYTSVAVSGTAYGNCPVGCNCYGVTHEPGAYNVLGGSTGGMEYGARVPWNNYLGETNNQQIIAAPGTLVNFDFNGLVLCSVVGTIYSIGEQSTQAASYTHIQHNCSHNPFGSKVCRISQFFDHPTPYGIHHAEDVVYDNGTGGGTNPTPGDPVYAVEGGTVEKITTGVPLSAWPACESVKGLHPADDVVVLGSDGYYTVYVEAAPAPGIVAGVKVTAGEKIAQVALSGCEDHPHVHVQRQDASGKFYNFTLPCINPTPTTKFWDGLVDDLVDDSNP